MEQKSARRAAWMICAATLFVSLPALHAQVENDLYQLPLPEVSVPPIPERPVVAIISNLTGNTTQTIPSVSTIGTTLQQVRDFFTENSYGRATFSFLTVATSTLSQVPTCEPPTGGQSALQQIVNAAVAAADPQVNYSQFGTVMVYAPFGQNCEWGGYYFGQIPYSTSEGSVTLHTILVNVRHTQRLVPAHELAHSLGLAHASRLQCNTPFIENSTTCAFFNGGDPYSVVGAFNAAQTPFHLDSLHKYLLGWFAPADVLNVRQSGSYDIYALEASSPAGFRSLRICRAPGKELYLDTRRAVLADTTIPTDAVSGVLLRVRDTNRTYPPRTYALPTESVLIDPHPASSGLYSLRVGQSVQDPLGGFGVAVNSMNHRKSTVSITNLNLPSSARPVTGLTCNYVNPIPPTLPDGLVTFMWGVGDCYDRIELKRNGVLIRTLDRDSLSYFDIPAPGSSYTYTISGVINGLPAGDVSCPVSVPCPPCRADYDADGDIDSSDQTQFNVYYGAGDLRADLNCDRVVNLVDAGIFSTKFGHSCP